MPSKAELQKRLVELETENDELQDALDKIADLAGPADEDDDPDSDNGDGDVDED